MKPCKIWIEQCEAARGIEDECGTKTALAYLVGEKFLNFLEAAEEDTTFQAELPAFVAEIKSLFEPWQIAECLEKTRQTEPFDPGIYEDDDPEDIDIEMERTCAVVPPTCWWWSERRSCCWGNSGYGSTGERNGTSDSEDS